MSTIDRLVRLEPVNHNQFGCTVDIHNGVSGHVETVCLLTHSWTRGPEKAWNTGVSVTGSKFRFEWWKPSFYVRGNWSRSRVVATILLFQKTSQRFYYFWQNEKTILRSKTGGIYFFSICSSRLFVIQTNRWRMPIISRFFRYLQRAFTQKVREIGSDSLLEDWIGS